MIPVATYPGANGLIATAAKFRQNTKNRMPTRVR